MFTFLFFLLFNPLITWENNPSHGDPTRIGICVTYCSRQWQMLLGRNLNFTIKHYILYSFINWVFEKSTNLQWHLFFIIEFHILSRSKLSLGFNSSINTPSTFNSLNTDILSHSSCLCGFTRFSIVFFNHRSYRLASLLLFL
jgi:hypothetical protein